MLQYKFEPVGGLSDQDIVRLNELLVMLSADAQSQTREHWEEVQEKSFLLLARDPLSGGKIAGMATLVPIFKPTKREGRIEDVVVDEDLNYRGHGIGRKLSQMLIDKARFEGIFSLELTSSPMRVAANKLYQSLGFQQRNTNVYSMEL